MCRHLAYLGPSRSRSRAAHRARALAPAARRSRRGTRPTGRSTPTGSASAGTTATRAEPGRYRTDPADLGRPSFATGRSCSSNGVLAAVRSPRPACRSRRAAPAPFADGPWLFSHNGIVPGFRDGVGRALRRKVEPSAAAVIEATDSEVLFALALDSLDAGASPAEALAVVVGLVDERAARLNLLLTDGEQVAATAWGNSAVRVRRASGRSSRPSRTTTTRAGCEDGSVVSRRRQLEVRPIDRRCRHR